MLTIYSYILYNLIVYIDFSKSGFCKHVLVNYERYMALLYGSDVDEEIILDKSTAIICALFRKCNRFSTENC